VRQRLEREAIAQPAAQCGVAGSTRRSAARRAAAALQEGDKRGGYLPHRVHRCISYLWGTARPAAPPGRCGPRPKHSTDKGAVTDTTDAPAPAYLAVRHATRAHACPTLHALAAAAAAGCAHLTRRGFRAKSRRPTTAIPAGYGRRHRRDHRLGGRHPGPRRGHEATDRQTPSRGRGSCRRTRIRPPPQQAQWRAGRPTALPSQAHTPPPAADGHRRCGRRSCCDRPGLPTRKPRLLPPLDGPSAKGLACLGRA